jgi:3-methyladenine DNA glycosylase AlkD
MHLEHKNILNEIKKNQKQGTKYFENDSYLGSGHHYYDVSVPIKRKIAKKWVGEHKDISSKEFILLLDSLYKGESYDEKTMASALLGYLSKQRSLVTPKNLNEWLGYLVGWAEVDSLCQNIFTYSEFLANWKEWERFIIKLSGDKNINKRRASIVFLTGPVRYSADNKFEKLSFEVVNTLKNEKSILITKAISWLLRSMVYNHKDDVLAYIQKNKDLPKIAIRETTRKIKTGRK